MVWQKANEGTEQISLGRELQHLNAATEKAISLVSTKLQFRTNSMASTDDLNETMISGLEGSTLILSSAGSYVRRWSLRDPS